MIGTVAAKALSLAAGSALAQDEKAKKQAEVRKVTQQSLEEFNKDDLQLKQAPIDKSAQRRRQSREKRT